MVSMRGRRIRIRDEEIIMRLDLFLSPVQRAYRGQHNVINMEFKGCIAVTILYMFRWRWCHGTACRVLQANRCRCESSFR
jgi:hypothetical protein